MSTNGGAIHKGIHILDGGNYKYIEGNKAKDVEGNMR